MAIRLEHPGEESTRRGTGEERRERDERRRDGDLADAPQREAEQHDVAGHVGGEDVAEAKVGHGVDQPGHPGQGKEDSHQQATSRSVG